MAQAIARRRSRPTLAMMPELGSAGLALALAPVKTGWRRSWFYRQLLRSRMPDRIRHYPFDALPHRLEDADALLKGRFRFAGATVDVERGSVFDSTPPSRSWTAGLHSFEWLLPLSAAGGEAARELAIRLISEWLERHSRYGLPAWGPDVMARRLVRILAHGRFVVANSDMLWRSKLFVSLRQQAALLGRIADEAAPGLPRLEASVSSVLACACLDDDPRPMKKGLARLEHELALQILPDGGHISRSPEQLLLSCRQIAMVIDTFAAAGYPIPPWLRNVHDRMAPMLRFFRQVDGALCVFNGGGEGDARTVAALLARDEVHGQPFLHAPHSGYHRLAAGRLLAVMDCGAPPPGPFSTQAHAGCLGFEFGADGRRIVVNCGAEKEDSGRWQGALRTTAAHSTVTIADTSMAAVLAPGVARNLLGSRLIASDGMPETRRRDTSNGCRIEASHSFYVPQFGIVHRRGLALSPTGRKLTGSDCLSPLRGGRRKEIPFAVRFHIHPDIRVSPAQGGDILLRLPGGEGWRFRHAGQVAVEESVYAGQDSVRRTEQLVLHGAVRSEPVETTWAFEQLDAE